MKNLMIFVLTLVILGSCKKDDSHPSEAKIIYSVESGSTQPGLFLTLKASEPITKDTCTVQIGGKAILLAKIDSIHYVFFVPVLSPGTYKLNLENLNAGNTTEVVIRNYTPILNSDEVLTASIKNYNNIADSLVINSAYTEVTLEDVVFMHQLMDQFAENIKLCTAEEKLLLAYQFQNLSLGNSVKQKEISSNPFTASIKVIEDDDPFNVMVSKALYAVGPKLKAFSAAGGVAAAVALSLINPILIPVFIIAIANYYKCAINAQKANAEALDYFGIAVDNLTEINASGTSENPLAVSIGRTFWQSFKVTFRTMRKSDATSTNIDIINFIEGVYELEKRDFTIYSMYNNIRSKFSGFFDKITTSYSPYISPVLTTAKEMIKEANSKFISVSNVSNPNITATAFDDGLNGLKLTFDNPSNNITTETNFTFQLTYSQAAIDNKVTTSEEAKFTPEAKVNIPKVNTRIVESITTTMAISGGNISDDGGSTIIARGIVWSISQNPTILNVVNNNITSDGKGTGSFTSNLTSLQENTTYYVRAYATNSSETGYGTQTSFTTLFSVKIPTLATISASSITQTTAITGGIITDNGGDSITVRGICWSTASNPTISNTHISIGSGPGEYTVNLIGLSANTQYYIRAYAFNSVGIAYGNECNFITSAFEIGQNYGGGIIAYIIQPGEPGYDANIQHGLIATPSDQATDVTWSNGSYILIGTSYTYGTGIANTNSIVAIQGIGSYAASICANLTIGGYNDWVLPNTAEMYRLWKNAYANGMYNGLPNGRSKPYWTSSEVGDFDPQYYAYTTDFYDGLQFREMKNSKCFVRAIRYF